MISSLIFPFFLLAVSSSHFVRMSTTTTTVKGQSALDFPALQSATEAARLQVQHTLAVDAVGGLVLAPCDLSKPDLRVLDCGTADGYYLHELRKQLPHPDSAQLYGIDIATYPPYSSTAAPQNIHISQQNVLSPFPAAWRNSFDLIQARTVLSNLCGRAQAVAALRNILPLLAPGSGHLQLIDGAKFPGPVSPSDKPSIKLQRTLANAAALLGRDLAVGADLPGLLADAAADSPDVEIEILETREVESRFGRGARTPQLEELGVQEMQSMYRVVRECMLPGVLDKVGVSKEEFDALEGPLVDEVRSEGVRWVWYVAVARRAR